METRLSNPTRWRTLDDKRRTALQARLQKARGVRTGLEFAPASVEIRSEFPVSSAQEQLWLVETLQPGTPTYNVSEVLQLDGDLNVQALERSINEILRRHESLRTQFFEKDGEPRQVIRPMQPFRLNRKILSHNDSAEQKREAEEIVSEEIQRPFDLAYDLLFRAELLQINGSRHVLVLVMHHIVTDGWSHGIVMLELFEFYKKIIAGEIPSLPALSHRYVDFAERQQHWFHTVSYGKVLSYWKEKLAKGPPALELPTRFPRPVMETVTGHLKRFAISAELTGRIVDLSKNERVTPFMVLLAALKILLRRYTKQEDIQVGSPAANRNSLEFEKVVGFFVNMLVLRTRVEPKLMFREVLQRVRDTALDAYAHQEMPFENLVKELRPDRAPNVNPFFQVAFMYENFPELQLQIPGLSISRLPGETNTSKFALTLVITESDEKLEGAIEYKAELFDPETIERMIKDYVVLLEDVTTNPGQELI